jgi:hypothetical protein
MSLDTQLPDGHRGHLSSPDLKLRDSTTIWGPLQVSIHNHRQGAELGYQAGEAAYQDLLHRFGQSTIGADTLEQYMNGYLTTPRYRPRVLTEKIATEWRAMFVLGWTNQMLEGLTYKNLDEQLEPTQTHAYQRREVRA